MSNEKHSWTSNPIPHFGNHISYGIDHEKDDETA